MQGSFKLDTGQEAVLVNGAPRFVMVKNSGSNAISLHTKDGGREATISLLGESHTFVYASRITAKAEVGECSGGFEIEARVTQ